jgi:hypothetical protein
MMPARRGIRMPLFHSFFLLRSDRIRGFLTAGCLAFTACHAPAALPSDLAPLFTRLDAPATVPAEIAGRAVFVSVSINGCGPFRMMVDTGCSASLISPEVALALDPNLLSASTSLPMTNAFGRSDTMPQVLLASIDCGTARFEGVTAGITSFELQSRANGFQVDGILGYSLFAGLYVTFDFPHRALRLSREWPQTLPPVRASLDATEDGGVPFVTLGVQGIKCQAIVDTGSNGSLQLSSSLAGALTWKTPPRPGSLIGAIGGVDREWTGRLTGTLEVGEVRQTEPVVSLSAGSPLLGIEFLRSFTLVFRPGGGKIWLCSESAADVPSQPVRTVGLSLLADAGGWRVVGIIPDSPAESARIAAGDVITEIEHRPARDWTRTQLQAWVDSHDTLALAVASAAGARDFLLPVWALVP